MFVFFVALHLIYWLNVEKYFLENNVTVKLLLFHSTCNFKRTLYYDVIYLIKACVYSFACLR